MKTSEKSVQESTLDTVTIIQLVLELLWVAIQSIPYHLAAVYRKFVPGEGKDLTDQIVVITGAGNGLGKEMALQFARQGCYIVCVDVRSEDNDTTVQEIRYETRDKERAKGYVCDISDTASVEKLRKAVLQDWGRVDILVNNAGIIYGNAFAGGEEDSIRRIIDINLLGTYWVTRAFLPEMKKRNQGHIVFINSMSSLTQLAKGTIYSTSKSALLGLTHSLDDEIRQEKSNIKVSSVHPYFIATQVVYAESFRTRVPPITTVEAAQQIITGVRREYYTFQIPGYEFGFNVTSMVSLLPRKVYHLLREVFSVDLILPETEQEYWNIPGKNGEDCDSYVAIAEKHGIPT